MSTPTDYELNYRNPCLEQYECTDYYDQWKVEDPNIDIDPCSCTTECDSRLNYNRRPQFFCQDVYIQGTLTVEKNTWLQALLTVSGDTLLELDLKVVGASTLQSTLDVAGVTTLEAGCVVVPPEVTVGGKVFVVKKLKDVKGTDFVLAAE